VVSVPLTTVLTVGAVVIALSWLIVLVTVPWNLHFAARRAAAEMVVSRERGISVRAAYDTEAARISGRMLRLALGAHLATAVAAAVIAYLSGSTAGYYVAGIFLLSTVFRPAGAYVAHVRERINVLTRESTHPRDDVAALREKAEELERAVDELRTDLRHSRDDLRGREARDEALGRRIDQMVRRIEAALDSISDHQELLTGLRALVRMVRSDPA
jgi:septal ring factor EnvC (AmiA/AmiB activator)